MYFLRCSFPRTENWFFFRVFMKFWWDSPVFPKKRGEKPDTPLTVQVEPGTRPGLDVNSPGFVVVQLLRNSAEVAGHVHSIQEFRARGNSLLPMTDDLLSLDPAYPPRILPVREGSNNGPGMLRCRNPPSSYALDAKITSYISEWRKKISAYISPGKSDNCREIRAPYSGSGKSPEQTMSSPSMRPRLRKGRVIYHVM